MQSAPAAEEKPASSKVSFFQRAKQRMEIVAESLDQQTSKLFSARSKPPRCQVSEAPRVYSHVHTRVNACVRLYCR